MLFIVNSSGVPSVATFVRLAALTTNQPPTATITSPATNTTIQAGQSVLFSGTASDLDGTVSTIAWSFPGGTPASATVLSPGNVKYSTPGSFVASLKATDNGGASSPVVTRTITVANFALSATPTSRTVVPGTGTSYTATVTGGAGFAGTVSFKVSGLPAGAIGTFTQTAITGSGSSTLNVTTSSTTAAGSYPLTITGTAGALTRSVIVTLVIGIGGDFNLSVSPTSSTVDHGKSTTYTVTIAPTQGSAGTVNLSVTGLPKLADATFAPVSVANSGTSTLTVATRNKVTRGTSTLTITGSNGARVHSAIVTLVIR